MAAVLDTSVLVRYLTKDPLPMAEVARDIIESANELLLTDVVLGETAYVLARFYKVPRPLIVDLLMETVQRDNVRMFALDKDDVLHGLSLCRPSGRVSFADALIWAAAHAAGVRAVYSFDRRFPDDGIEVLRRAL